MHITLTFTVSQSLCLSVCLCAAPYLDELGVPRQVSDREAVSGAHHLGDGLHARAEPVRDVALRPQLLAPDLDVVWKRTEKMIKRRKLDLQVENQPREAYIGRTAVVPIPQCPSQPMSEFKRTCRNPIQSPPESNRFARTERVRSRRLQHLFRWSIGEDG